MPVRQILKNGSRYYGKYVALKSFDSKKIVTSAKTILEVHTKAKKLGIAEPVIVYVHKKNSVHIY